MKLFQKQSLSHILQNIKKHEKLYRILASQMYGQTTTSLPSPKELKEKFPLDQKTKNRISLFRQEVKNIFLKKDHRFLFILGPCSIHDTKSAFQYAYEFKGLKNWVKDQFFLIMRVYLEKPRTQIGWKGFLYDPHLDGSNDLKTGLHKARKLLLEMSQLEIPCAMELVDPLAAAYFDDLLIWGCIGARTSASQPHRQMASSLDFPIGFKNGTDGDLKVAIQGVKTSQVPHHFLGIDEKGKIASVSSKGNPYSHIVLRGSEQKPNYYPESISLAIQTMEQYKLDTSLIIDCSHGNCQKDHEKQKISFESTIFQMKEKNEKIMGLMLESHLKEGNQPLGNDPNSLLYGVSITDPCIDWETTEKWILWANKLFQSLSTSMSGVQS